MARSSLPVNSDRSSIPCARPFALSMFPEVARSAACQLCSMASSRSSERANRRENFALVVFTAQELSPPQRDAQSRLRHPYGNAENDESRITGRAK